MKIEKIKEIIDNNKSRKILLEMIQLKHQIKIKENETTQLMGKYRGLDIEITQKHKLGIFDLPTLISTLESKENTKWLKELKLLKPINPK